MPKLAPMRILCGASGGKWMLNSSGNAPFARTGLAAVNAATAANATMSGCRERNQGRWGAMMWSSNRTPFRGVRQPRRVAGPGAPGSAPPAQLSAPQHLHQAEDDQAADRGVRARTAAARTPVDAHHHEPVVLARGPEVAGGHAAVLREARLGGGPVEVSLERRDAGVGVLRPGKRLGALRRGLEVADLLHVVDVADVEDAQPGGEAVAGGDSRVVGVVDVAVVAGEAKEAGARCRGGGGLLHRRIDRGRAVRRIVDVKDELGGDLGVLRIADVDQPREAAAGLALLTRGGSAVALVAEEDVGLSPDGDGKRVLRAHAAIVPRERADHPVHGVGLALLEIADVEEEQPVASVRRWEGAEHGDVRRVAVLRELQIV